MPNINLLSSHEAAFTNPQNIPLREKSISVIFVLKNVCVYMSSWRPEGVGSAGIGVTGSCGLPDMYAGIQF